MIVICPANGFHLKLASLSVAAEEEISAMKKELDKYGIQMPAFGKIGGILANEVSKIIILSNDRCIYKSSFIRCPWMKLQVCFWRHFVVHDVNIFLFIFSACSSSCHQ